MFGHVPLPRFPSNYFPLLIFILKTWKKNKIITTIHELNSDLNSVASKIILKFLLYFSDKFIVHNKRLMEFLEKNGISRKNIVVVTIGTPKGKILDKEICKKKLNLLNKKILTIFGFVCENKGHDLVIDILPELDKNVVLLIAGGPRVREHEEYYSYLKNKVSILDLDNRVKFLGFVKENDLPVIFSATDIAIFPYRWIVASEALHLALGYKIPTIASDLDYFREIKNKYDCIVLFKNNNSRDLLAKIQKLLNSEKKQKYLKRKCEEFCRKTSWKEIAKKHITTYLETICGHDDEIYGKEYQKERIEWLKNNKEGNTLEIGCATGFVTNYVKADVGIDLRGDRLLLAKLRYPHISFIKSDASKLPFRDNAFDTVLVPDILEHVPFDIAKKILYEAYRVCSKKILITLPNGSGSVWDEDHEVGSKNPEHLWRPTKQKVNELLSGYSNYKITTSNEEIFLFIQIFKK